MQIVTTHKNTDFDALASLVAAKLLYPDVRPVIPKNVNPNVRAFLSIHKDMFSMETADEIDFDAVDRLLVVDVNRWERLENMKPLMKRDDLDIFLWDHHSVKGNILAQWQCQEETGANVTLMIRQLKDERKLLTPIQATLLLAGIYEDTGNLTFPSTTAEDASAVAWLLERKADLSIISSFLRPAYGEKQKQILFEMVKSADRRRINGYSVSLNRMELNGHVEGLAVVVRMYREILNVDAAFGIFYSSDRKRCIVIGRSNADGLNIGSIMKSLGGGGHPGAGSALLKAVNPETVESMIEELLRGNQQASVQISDIMSFPVSTIAANAPMKEAMNLLQSKGCTGMPVVDGDTIVGIISRRDFRKVRKRSQEEAPVKAFMSTSVMTIEPGKSPLQAARLMVKHDIGRLPVVEDGRLIGIVTRSDAMMYFYDLLPD